MSETLEDIICRSKDIFTFSIGKTDGPDRSSWTFRVTDRRSPLYGTTGRMGDYRHKGVTLRRGDHFFFAYRFDFPETGPVYMVDIRRSCHKTSVRKYVDNLVRFYMKSNDISYRKNDCSFKVSDLKMRSLGIGNFVELCHHFCEFSSIGIGLTRDVRNLVVLDIDVDCREDCNRAELDRILLVFAIHGMLPDFEIHNNDNGHIQLQWLIQPYPFKERCEEMVSELAGKLKKGDRNCEVPGGLVNCNYTRNTEESLEYRIMTKALTDVSPEPKFGDKNFTFWKAKNFCTALYRMYNLELRMPQYRDGRIAYLSDDEMYALFSTKEARELYSDEAPEFKDLVALSRPFLSDLVPEVRKSVSKEDTCCDDGDVFESEYDGSSDPTWEESRNNFVFRYTKTVTWDICRELRLKSYEDIAAMPDKEYRKLVNTVRRKVREEYDRLNREYGGVWPGTSNMSPFTRKEFDSAFKGAFDFAKCKFNNTSKYSDEQRENSMRERGFRKDMRLILVDYHRNIDKGLKRDELLKKVNSDLRESGQKEISLSSLKRYIDESKSLTDDGREKLYSGYCREVTERERKLSETSEDDEKERRNCKRRLDYIRINIMDDIIKTIGK